MSPCGLCPFGYDEPDLFEHLLAKHPELSDEIVEAGKDKTPGLIIWDDQSPGREEAPSRPAVKPAQRAQ